MRGTAILLGFNLIGLALSRWGHVPLPAGVIGLILFAACLFAKVIKLAWVEESAHFLLKHMLLFFAPVVVGSIVFTPLLRREWAAVTAGLVGSYLVVLLVTGWVAKLMVGHDRGER